MAENKMPAKIGVGQHTGWAAVHTAKMKGDTVYIRSDLVEPLVEALRRADQFITNGIELGFIRMPDPDCPDTAHQTPGLIRAALAAYAAAQSGQAQTEARRD